METSTHLGLKRLAIRRLFAEGCAAVAAEVRCPIARFRVDVAGYLDPLPRNRGVAFRAQTEAAVSRGEAARTVIVECKASRADFLIDSRDAERLLKKRERLLEVRKATEESFVKVVEPHLRREGTSLFSELDEWNFAESRLPSYRALLEDLRQLDERLYGQSKFWTVARYRLADYLYLAAPAGMIRARELPAGWGLIESTSGEDAVLNVAVAATARAGNAAHRARMLRNIAAAASRREAARSGRVRIDNTAPSAEA